MEELTQNNYEMLEEQIGNVGGVNEAPETMGRLKHAAAYGGKEQLNDSEQKSMEDFLSRSRRHKERTDDEVMVKDGWIPVDRTEMAERSIFYPESWEFYIRPATVQAIKNWTAIDEERADVVNNVFNEIVKTCVKIETHDGTKASWSDIKSWDRFWFILKVREYTYSHGQSKVEFQDECSECGEEIDYTLTSQKLFYEFPDDELIENYWKNGKWVIDPREYDVDEDPITLYTPTLGRDAAIIEWASAKVRAGGKIDETFVQYLMWLLDKPAKDMQMLDRQIGKIYKAYKAWSLDMFTFMSDVIKNITINQSEKLKTTCPHCGKEAISTVQFPNGLKVLFEVRSNAKKFGSR